MACSAATEGSNKMTGPSGAAGKHRVLVVEDEMLIGMLLEDMLTDLGHEVAALVPRLKEAMAAVDRETYDLAILDVHLHGEPLYLAVLNYLFSHRVAGATVTKGVAGFGAGHHLHTARILELSENLPLGFINFF